MPDKQTAELVLKRNLTVVDLLILDVLTDRVYLRRTYGEDAVPVLPSELGQDTAFRLEPLRRTCFDFLDQVACRVILRQVAKEMHMVVDAVDENRGGLQTLEDGRRVGVQLGTNI